MRTSHKMYLTLILSTACIFLYQYQLSKARLLSSSSQQSIVLNEVLQFQQSQLILSKQNRKSQKRLLASAVAGTSPTTTTTTVIPTTTTTSTNVNLNVDTKYSTKSILPQLPPIYNNKQSSLSFSSVQTQNTINSILNTTSGHPPPPPLYIITPTYRRPEQLAELTRLGYTLKHVPNIFWLVIEDAEQPTPLVTKLLEKMKIPFEHLVAQMPAKYRKNKIKPRGVSNRNRGLEWVRANASEGVLYFADDDNTYDLDIFDQMRYTKKVSMWPVGLITKFGVSSPIVKNGLLTGFYDGWIGGRKYPVDMAGFAVNVQFFLSRPKAQMPFKPGYEEDGFLKSLAPLNLTEIELLASNCTEILTWHTQTKKNPPAMTLDVNKYNATNLVSLRKILV